MRKRSFAPIRPDNPGEATYPHSLPIELALKQNPISEICEHYGLGRDDLVAISELPQFQAQYEWALEEMTKPGGVERLQCAMMSGEAVKVLYMAMTDVENNINQRAAHAKDILRYAWIEPPKPKEGVDPSDRFNININLAPSPAAQPSQINILDPA
jgi:hypothetical protein